MRCINATASPRPPTNVGTFLMFESPAPATVSTGIWRPWARPARLGRAPSAPGPLGAVSVIPGSTRPGVRASVCRRTPSGDRDPGDGTVQTFNPLFPSGSYFSLAAYTGFTNLIHLKPSLTVRPTARLTALAGVGFLWRETTADAIYTQPMSAVPGSAGLGGRWTGAYGQVRLDYVVRSDLTAAIEAVRYEAGSALRSSGGRDGDYFGLELKLSL